MHGLKAITLFLSKTIKNFFGIFFQTLCLCGIAFAQKGQISSAWKNQVIYQLDLDKYNFSLSKTNNVVANNPVYGIDINISDNTQVISDNSYTNHELFSISLRSVSKSVNYIAANESSSRNYAKNKYIETHENYTIEYINNESGLKQNFIIHQPLHGNTPLVVSLKLNYNNAKALIQNNELVFINDSEPSKEIARYGKLCVYDANNNNLEAYFNLINNDLQIIVNDNNAIYPITIDPLSTTANTQIIYTMASAEFGYCVSTAGDVNGDGYTDVIVGAPLYANGHTKEGAAFV